MQMQDRLERYREPKHAFRTSELVLQEFNFSCLFGQMEGVLQRYATVDYDHIKKQW